MKLRPCEGNDNALCRGWCSFRLEFLIAKLKTRFEYFFAPASRNLLAGYRSLKKS